MKRPKLLNRPPPTWQNQKLVLARKMVSKLDGIEQRLDTMLAVMAIEKKGGVRCRRKLK